MELKLVKYFHKKAPSQTFDRVSNTLLIAAFDISLVSLLINGTIFHEFLKFVLLTLTMSFRVLYQNLFQNLSFIMNENKLRLRSVVRTKHFGGIAT